MKWSKIKQNINDVIKEDDNVSTVNLNFNVHTSIEIDIDRTKGTKNSYAIRSVNEDVMEGLVQDNKW